MLCCRPLPPLLLVDRFTHKSLSSLLSRSHSFPFKRRYFHSFLCVQFFYLEKLNQQKQDHGILSFPLVSVFFPWPKNMNFGSSRRCPSFSFSSYSFVSLLPRLRSKLFSPPKVLNCKIIKTTFDHVPHLPGTRSPRSTDPDPVS